VGPHDERTRHLAIFFVTAPCAAIVWAIFHAVYENLSTTAKAIGYVDSLTQVLIGLGYVAMVGGTLVLGAIAVWSGVAYLLLLRRDR
jgi:hypothetical protein